MQLSIERSCNRNMVSSTWPRRICGGSVGPPASQKRDKQFSTSTMAALVTSWENEGVPHRSNCPASAVSRLEYQRPGLLRQLTEGYRSRREGECKRPHRRCQTLLGWIPLGGNGCCLRCLFASYNGIITTMGDNNYSHHTGSIAAHSRSKRAGDTHDRSMPLNDVHRAE